MCIDYGTVGSFRMRDTLDGLIADIKSLLDDIYETDLPQKTKILSALRTDLNVFLKEGDIIKKRMALLFSKVRAENGKKFRGQRIVLSPPKKY